MRTDWRRRKWSPLVAAGVFLLAFTGLIACGGGGLAAGVEPDRGPFRWYRAGVDLELTAQDNLTGGSIPTVVEALMTCGRTTAGEPYQVMRHTVTVEDGRFKIDRGDLRIDGRFETPRRAELVVRQVADQLAERCPLKASEELVAVWGGGGGDIAVLFDGSLTDYQSKLRIGALTDELGCAVRLVMDDARVEAALAPRSDFGYKKQIVARGAVRLDRDFGAVLEIEYSRELIQGPRYQTNEGSTVSSEGVASELSLTLRRAGSSSPLFSVKGSTRPVFPDAAAVITGVRTYYADADETEVEAALDGLAVAVKKEGICAHR